jgi:parallel beta-helix repeat protein
MTNLGYPSGGDSHFTQVRNYLNDKRSQFGTDWAFAIFVADSLNDNDGEFPDGFFAYTYLNGPFMVLTYDNSNWGIDLMQIVMAHETAHVWGALDEYAQSGCTDSETGGYLNVANTNCENGDPPTEDSIVRGAFNQEFVAFPNHLISTPARQMVGWRDLDGDGKNLYDPVDTTPVIFLSSFSPDPTTDRTPTYSGTAVDVPFPSPAVPDVTINTITAVEWRVNGGIWQQATALDGAFDSESEDFVFTSFQLTAGIHHFEVRATNSVGNTSLIVSDILTVSSILPVNCSTMSLQEAFAVVGPGDTISLTGTCNENILIRNENARIVLDGGGTASIQGISAGSPAITVRGKGILIQNLTISGGSTALHVNRGANAVINNNMIHNSAGHGVLVDQLAFATITSNTIENNSGAGVLLSEGSTARIGFNDDGENVASPNLIQNNTVGVIVASDSSARIAGNSINNNNDEGIAVIRSSSADISNNQINGNGGDGIFVGEKSAVQLGEDSGASIFEAPNTTSLNNGGFGVACVDGGLIDGRLGSLSGAAGPSSFDLTCSNDLLP